MAKRSRTPGGDAGSYDTGYGKPPVATQFQKGRSGNPRGRPKNTRNVSTMMNSLLDEKVTILNKNGSRSATAQEVMLRRLRESALKGDLKAMLTAFNLAGRNLSNAVEAIDISADLDDSDKELLQRFILRNFATSEIEESD